jgi:hypothetical protein
LTAHIAEHPASNGDQWEAQCPFHDSRNIFSIFAFPSSASPFGLALTIVK